jgi:hypothetical protein
MDAQRWFELANAFALPGWAALLFLAPVRRAAAVRIARMVGALLAAGYLAGFVYLLGAVDPPPADASLAVITTLFADPRLALVAWIHYLAFDLWVGAWEVEAAGKTGMRHLFVVPALVLTFLLGPIGLLTFLVLRAATARGVQR